nr:hypothetical protein Itr_chr08CG01110 [Ipomoea trifida]
MIHYEDNGYGLKSSRVSQLIIHLFCVKERSKYKLHLLKHKESILTRSHDFPFDKYIYFYT